MAGIAHVPLMPVKSVVTPAVSALDCSILLVESRQDARGSHHEILASQGYRVLRALSAEQAVRILSRDNEIAIVVVHLVPSDGDAASLVRELRAVGKSRDWIEYLVLAAREAMMPASADERQGVEYLTGPFTDDQLIASVAEAYNLARMQRFRHEEMRSLKESLLEFKTRTDVAVSQLIARAQDTYGISNAPSPLRPSDAADDVSLVGYIDEECRRARLRDRIFGACSLNQAAWMLFLLIGKAELTGMRLTIKAAAYSAGMPLSSALRKINELCSSGLLARQEDPADARRSFVNLTSGGRSFLTQYLSEYPDPRERSAER